MAIYLNALVGLLPQPNYLHLPHSPNQAPLAGHGRVSVHVMCWLEVVSGIQAENIFLVDQSSSMKDYC